MCAKLIDEQIIYAKNPLEIDDKLIITNDFTLYGYKPVVIPEAPTQEGYYPVFDGWEETEKEIVQNWRLEPIPTEQIVAELKQQLAESDYKAIKYAEGWYTEEEYAPIKAKREALRERIRELENAEYERIYTETDIPIEEIENAED